MTGTCSQCTIGTESTVGLQCTPCQVGKERMPHVISTHGMAQRYACCMEYPMLLGGGIALIGCGKASRIILPSLGISVQIGYYAPTYGTSLCKVCHAGYISVISASAPTGVTQV